MHKDMEITGIILAGGQGRRFAYQDKGLIHWQQRMLIEHVIDRLAPQVSRTLISCNQNLDRYQALGYTTVQDENNNFNGPLAGIAAALALCNTPLALIAPCDCPLLPTDLAKRLVAAFKMQDGLPPDVAIAFDGTRSQFLIALLQTRLLPNLQNFLASKNFAVKDWYKSLSIVEVDFSDQSEALVNVNSKTELDQLPPDPRN